MTALLMTITLILSPPPLNKEIGILSQYAVGVMPYTVEARQEWGQLPEDLSGIDGFVAVWDCNQIGRVGLLSIDGGEWQTIMVADCSGHVSTTTWMQENNVLAEISGELAEAAGVTCLCAVPGEIIWLDQ